MYKRKYISIIIILVILFSVVIDVSADNKALVIDYYGLDNCINCKEVEELLDKLDTKYGNEIIINRKDISDDKYEDEFLIRTSGKGEQTIVPTIIIGDKILQGVGDIKEYINIDMERDIKDIRVENVTEIEKDRDVGEIYESKFKNMTLLVIITAGLLDGVNPCAMAMLLFFMTMLLALEDKNRALKAGISYNIAIFITYLVIGLGLLKTLQYFSGLTNILKAIYIITIIICVYLIIIDVKDYRKLREGKVTEVKNELSKGVRHKIHNIIRKHINSKYIVLTTFLAGVMVALLEFSCTGQVYIPTITFIISQGNVKALTYLIIYNIFFTIPTVIITILVYKTSGLMEASNILIDKRKYIKLGSIIFYTIIIIYFIYRLSIIT